MADGFDVRDTSDPGEPSDLDLGTVSGLLDERARDGMGNFSGTY